MASKYWLKLFHETIYDPKVMMMSPGARLRFYECLCLAGDYDRGGDLPATQHMAFVFRVSEDQLLAELNELIAAGIFDLVDGTYTIKKFGDRQSAMDVKERVERYRYSKRNEEYEEQKRNSNEPVTNRYADIDIDTDIELEEEVEKKITTVVVSSKTKDKTPLKAQAASMLKTRMISNDILKDLLQVYKPDMLIDYCYAYDQALVDGKADGIGWLIKALNQQWDIKALLKKRNADLLQVDPARYVTGQYAEFIEH